MTAADVDRSLEKIRAETSVSRLLNVTCAELAALLDASRCSVSRIIGDLLVELSDFHRSGDPPDAGAVPRLAITRSRRK